MSLSVSEAMSTWPVGPVPERIWYVIGCSSVALTLYVELYQWLSISMSLSLASNERVMPNWGGGSPPRVIEPVYLKAASTSLLPALASAGITMSGTFVRVGAPSPSGVAPSAPAPGAAPAGAGAGGAAAAPDAGGAAPAA